MSLFTLLLGGELARTPRLDAQIAGSRVIAADSGMRHALALGLTPELWVGDFNSVPPALAERFPDVPRQAFPAEKDKTDGELAVQQAIGLGATRLILAGAFGGPRADHAFLHLAQAVVLAEAGIAVLLTSGAQEGLPLLPGRMELDHPDGTLFSVVGFTPLAGLSLSGVKWPLEGVDLPFGSSLTISNVVRGRAAATLASGRALVIAHPYPGEDF